MWNDRLRVVTPVAEEWRALTAPERDTLKQVMERIDEDPIVGVPLFPPLEGLWSFREGLLRILYRIAPEARMVLILKIERVEGLNR